METQVAKHRKKPFTAQVHIFRWGPDNKWVLAKVQKTGVWQSLVVFISSGRSRSKQLQNI